VCFDVLSESVGRQVLSTAEESGTIHRRAVSRQLTGLSRSPEGEMPSGLLCGQQIKTGQLMLFISSSAWIVFAADVDVLDEPAIALISIVIKAKTTA